MSFSDNMQALFGMHASKEMQAMLGRALAPSWLRVCGGATETKP